MDSSTIDIHPRPGFVTKTRVITGPGHGKKLFINVCHDARVPRPDLDFDPATVFPLIIANQWEVPICVSKQRDETDKQGMPCLVVECCINSECMTWVHLSPDLLGIVVEWCFEALETINQYELDRNWLIPKMVSKGDIGLLEMDLQSMHSHMDNFRENEQLGLLEELKDDADPSDEKLPNLLDIGGTREKFVIEEIDNVHPEKLLKSDNIRPGKLLKSDTTPLKEISDQQIETKNTSPNSPSPKRPLIQEIEDFPALATDPTNKSQVGPTTSTTDSKTLDYNLTLSTHGTNLLIKVKCKEIPTVAYDMDQKCLVITPPLPYTFEGKSDLLVPVPLSTQLTHACENFDQYIDTFYEKALHALMVFLPLNQ